MTDQVVVSLNLLAICMFFWEECIREKSFPHTSCSLWAKVVETFCHFLQQAHAVEQPQQTQPPEKSAWFSKKQAPSWGGTPVTGTCEIFLFCFVFESPICNLVHEYLIMAILFCTFFSVPDDYIFNLLTWPYHLNFSDVDDWCLVDCPTELTLFILICVPWQIPVIIMKEQNNWCLRFCTLLKKEFHYKT